MTGARSCPRLFEAEAMRDGRLAGGERTSFERHLTVCVACAREVEALSTMTAALRAASPPAADELRVRRERTRLLAAFDDELVGPSRPSVLRRFTFGVAAVVALGLAVVFVRRARGGEHARGLPEPRRAVVIHADAASEWSERTERDRELVVLERGRLWIHVVHAPGSRRLLVVLPDGELEDTGTTFSVSALPAHTTRVAVRDGSVVLRLRGKSPVTLGPGETWTPAGQAAASSTLGVSPSPSGEPAPQAPARPSAASSASLSSPALGVSPSPSSGLARRLASRSAESPAEPMVNAPAPDPSIEFRRAVSALTRGDERVAADGFTEFIAKHPRDPRAEDAAYLRIIALQRSGDRDGAKAAATSYLRTYPTGFRHAEVESLSR